MRYGRIVQQVPTLQQQIDELLEIVWHLEHVERKYERRHPLTVASVRQSPRRTR